MNFMLIFGLMLAVLAVLSLSMAVASPSKLVQKATIAVDAASPSLWRRYAELLADGADTDAELAELQKIMPLIGKSPVELEGDHAIIVQFRELRQVIRNGRAAEEQAIQARKKLDAVIAENKRIAAERDRLLQDASREVSGHQGRHDEAIKAIDALNELRLRYGKLLAHEPAATKADLV